MDEIMNLELYELMGLSPSCTVQEIKTAYRKKALLCHPDKNPDNPKATELFHELSRALEILTDTSARAAYDKVIKARQQAKQRSREFDAKRKKFKDILDAREEAYRNSLRPEYNVKSDEEKLKEEIERLKKEGSKQVEEEVQFVKQKIQEQLNGLSGKSCANEACFRIKIKWKAAKDDSKNGGYDYDILYRILSKYGDISVLVISSTKKGRAMVEFKSQSSAETAVQIEIGLVENPLILEGLWSKSTSKSSGKNLKSGVTLLPAFASSSVENQSNPCTFTSFPSAPNIFSSQKRVSDAEFESIVMGNLRRAEERKRLLEQLENEQ